MNTAQVSIELVLAGLLAMCAFILPFFPGADLNSDLVQSEALIGILGMAYLLGVIFDKLADTILHPMEHILRLQQADEYLNDHPEFKGKDPFPQNRLEFNLRKSKDGRLDWMNTLKSRIRTTRELAVLGLPAAMGIAIYQSPALLWIYIPVLLNLFFFITAVYLESISSDAGRKTQLWQIKRIKTHDLSRKVSKRKVELLLAERQARKIFIPYYLLLLISAGTIGLVAVFSPKTSQILVIGVGGLILSMLALWTCQTITRTYLRFIAREMPGYLKEKMSNSEASQK